MYNRPEVAAVSGDVSPTPLKKSLISQAKNFDVHTEVADAVTCGSYRPNVCLMFRIQEWNMDGTDLTKTYNNICNFPPKMACIKEKGSIIFLSAACLLASS
jgi:hypothetical protein